MNKEQVKEKLRDITEQFSSANKNKDFINSQNEEWIKWNYLEPLFEILGWNRQDIMKEPRVLKGRADYILKVGNEEVLVVEAKKVGTNLSEDEGRQAVSYAYHRKIKFAVLTNFKEVRVYHALNNIKQIDQNLIKFESGSLFRLNFENFIDNFDKLMLLSKESFENKVIIKLLPSKLEKASKPIDESILDDLLHFRDWLSKDLKKTRMHLTKEQIDEIVQILIDRLIFMRSVEDRGLEPKNFLLGLIDDARLGRTEKSLWSSLKDKFKIFDKEYNSKLFAEGLLEKEGFFDEQTLVKVIRGLYFGTKELQARYMFDEIPGDLLGNIYEQYLGTILQGTEKRVKLELESGKRKKMGIYYTPSYIVDYIVKNTVGEYIKDKNIDEILDVKIVDPACGSGSFLIRAFQEVCNAIEERLKKGEKGRMPSFQSYKERLSFSQKISIIIQCIYGVDLDEKAVELAQLNLLLKLLEDETPESHKRLLPNLRENIKCGNSLIDDISIAGDKAFKWEAQFPRVFKDGGFDVVIGNPPYVNVENINKKDRDYLLKKYSLVKGRFDLYAVFMEQALTILNNAGKFSFIIPFPFTYERYAEGVRKEIAEKYTINELLDLSKNKIFAEAIVRNIVFIVTKNLVKSNKIKISNLDVVGNKIYSLEHKLLQDSFKNNPNYAYRVNLTDNKLKVIEKILNGSSQLGEMFYINWGLRTGDIKKYVGTNGKVPNAKKMINGRNVKKYFLEYYGEYVAYEKDKLYNPMFPELFENPKIFVPDISGNKGIRATCDYDNYYSEHTVSVVVRKDRLVNVKRNGKEIIEDKSMIKTAEGLDEKYILALLNSKIINFLFLERIGGGLHVYPDDIKQLPIKIIPPKKQEHIIYLIDQMLSLQKKFHETNLSGGEKERLEQQIKNIDYEIDQEVYALYGITKDEQKIIEESLK